MRGSWSNGGVKGTAGVEIEDGINRIVPGRHEMTDTAMSLEKGSK